ncbi:hypothetical protein ABZ901_23025 [Actinacidiphila alni]|uniref:hypothetical protein n=1 Tax=Actinacidiphila alni TaxID=380248 RepID=UPI0033F095CB
MTDAEIVQWLEQSAPYFTGAIGAYGTAVLTRAEDAAADSTVTAGRRALQLLWRRQSRPSREELEQAVAEAAAGTGAEGSHVPAALGALLLRALREDAALRAEVAALLAEQDTGRAPGTAPGSGAAAESAEEEGWPRRGDHGPTVWRSRIGGDNIQIGSARDVRIQRA